MARELNYDRDVQIDPSALDVEWLDQAQTFMRYARHAEETRRDVDWAKERLEVKKAELDKAVRSDPDKYGIARISEGAILNTIMLDAEYKDLSDKFIEAKYEAGMAQAAVRAMDQRKTALENLVRLHASSYFAGPRVPRDLVDEHQQRKARQERSDDKVASAMASRRAQSDTKPEAEAPPIRRRRREE
jgi:hypothetical protein